MELKNRRPGRDQSRNGAIEITNGPGGGRPFED